jgi:micrococcal nuclease
VWLPDALVNAEVARAGLGVPVQFNGQIKFLPPVQQAALEARQLKRGAYADHVECALPAKVNAALASMGKAKRPSRQTSAAYVTAIISLAAARKAATEVKLLTTTARRSSGPAAWAFHDAVRATQRTRIQSGIARADQRLKELRSSETRLKTKEKAAERKRQREREQARQERQAEREQAAREAEANRQQQQPEHDDSDTGDPGGSNPPGYTGPRCYEPGGQVWHPC